MTATKAMADQDLTAMLQDARLVVLDFFTPDCIPCRKLDAMLTAVAGELQGRLLVNRVDASASPELTEKYGVRGVPTLLLFKEGRLVARNVGFATASELREWVKPHLSRVVPHKGECEEMREEMRLINSDNAPAPPGPFSHATVVGSWVFTAGMGGLDPRTREVVSDDVIDQARQSIANLRAILSAAGCTLSDVVKAVVYLTDMADYSGVNAVYEQAFGTHRPARTCVAVSALPVRERVKIECVAYKAADS